MLTSLSINRGGLGRFGNQLWTIAGVIGTAIKSGQPYAFPKWLNQDNALFGGTVDDMNEFFVNPLPALPEGLSFTDYGYFWGYRDLHLPTGNWNIDAHMQSPKFFEHCIDVIREQFSMKDEPALQDVVAIHFRAGDYTEGAEGHHPRCNKEYYEKAMAMFPVGTQFVVFTDDPKAWNDLMNTQEDNENIYCDHTHTNYIDDFRLMKRCRHFITANSSFSSMAAMLGEAPDKIVVQPGRWFGTSMPEPYKSDTKDIYLPNAIII